MEESAIQLEKGVRGLGKSASSSEKRTKTLLLNNKVPTKDYGNSSNYLAASYERIENRCLMLAPRAECSLIASRVVPVARSFTEARNNMLRRDMARRSLARFVDDLERNIIVQRYTEYSKTIAPEKKLEKPVEMLYELNGLGFTMAGLMPLNVLAIYRILTGSTHLRNKALKILCGNIRKLCQAEAIPGRKPLTMFQLPISKVGEVKYLSKNTPGAVPEKYTRNVLITLFNCFAYAGFGRAVNMSRTTQQMLSEMFGDDCFTDGVAGDLPITALTNPNYPLYGSMLVGAYKMGALKSLMKMHMDNLLLLKETFRKRPLAISDKVRYSFTLPIASIDLYRDVPDVVKRGCLYGISQLW